MKMDLIVARSCDCQAMELWNREMVVLGEVQNLSKICSCDCLVNARDLLAYYHYYWQLQLQCQAWYFWWEEYQLPGTHSNTSPLP